MRLVHYLPYLLGPESGTGNSAREWCEALARAGADVTVMVDERKPLREPPAGSKCIQIRHRFRGPLYIPAGVSETIVPSDVLVVHGGWTAWNVAACRGANDRGIPYVIMSHGAYHPSVLGRRALRKRIWNIALERRHLARALAAHFFFSEEAEGLQQLGVSTPHMTVPNGMSYRPDQLWDGGSGGYLLWLGRFDPHVKGLDLLIRSYLCLAEEERPILRLHGPDWRGQKDKVSELVAQLGLEKWIMIGDPIYGDAKWQLIKQAAAAVYPSRLDACPIAVAEAVATGVPTLVADFPLGRLFAAEGAALMCERSPERIAEGIRRLMSQEGRELGRRGIEIAQGELSWDTVAQSWMDQLSGYIRQHQ